MGDNSIYTFNNIFWRKKKLKMKNDNEKNNKNISALNRNSNTIYIDGHREHNSISQIKFPFGLGII